MYGGMFFSWGIIIIISFEGVLRMGVRSIFLCMWRGEGDVIRNGVPIHGTI